ncbi:MAG: non-ribosomal peptide synthetase [Hydrogenophaga sp.]|uniref:non-ribosomal peptide synthetase n=1 Tax=Hydrogenophaga sp. TaxID=1904254 RepID=UPI0025B8CB6B|nr:non-ribosomal peptide synthetase [Hydrogenophaga sp.]
MNSSTPLSTFASLILQRSEQFKDQLALVFLQADLQPAETLTYGELANAAQTIAASLLKSVKRGDRVLLAYDNCIDAVLLFWGCIVAGVVAVPAPAPDARRSKLSWRRLLSMCDDAQVSMAFTRGEHIGAAEINAPHVKWSTLDRLGDWRGTPPVPLPSDAPERPITGDDLGYLQYTSGSTGQPRGAQITHDNMMAQCESVIQVADIDSALDRTLTWLPWFHDYGLVHGLLVPAHHGSTSFLMSTQQFLIRPLRWLEAIERHGITNSGAPDFAYEACVNALARYPDATFSLQHWKLASCGAEPIRPNTLRKFAEAFAPSGFRPEAFSPSYGLAEAVLAVSLGNSRAAPQIISVDRLRMEELREVHELPAGAEGSRELVGSGHVLPGLDVRIVDPQTRVPCAPHVVGEIWVRGPSVGRGYWNQPDASRERFGGQLAEEDRDNVFLRTGDLGFFKNGEIFVTGRHSDLIIIHGRNIHPQDLEETALAASKWVRPKGAIACPVEHAGHERVVLLVECRNQLPASELEQLQADLRRDIAEAHEVDLLDVMLLRGGTLPRTSSGKLQRREAKRMYLSGELTAHQLKASPVARETSAATERLMSQLAPLWADVLNVPHVPADAHFLRLGGDSLTGTQLLSRVRQHWGVEMPISTLFADPTLHGMAKALGALQDGQAHPAQALSNETELTFNPLELQTSTQLSYSQERMWFMQAMAPASSAYNVPLALRLRGTVQPEALEKAFQVVVKHHEILRTRFVATDQGLAANVVEDGHFQLALLDLPGQAEGTDEAALAAVLSELSHPPFALDQWPLMRATLIRLGPQEHVLLMVLHHIVADQWSFSVLGKDLSSAYRQAMARVEPVLPGPPPRYAVYSRWHRQWFETERQRQEIAYWGRRLEGMRPVALVPDHPRPRQASFRGASIRLPLPAGLTDALASLATQQDATLAMALLALFKVFLLKHTGQTDLAVGMPIANRHHPGCENLIGTLVNILVIRTSLDGDPDFTEVLRRVKGAALGAYEHQDLPFELLVRTLDHQREPSQPPLFNVMFNLVSTPVREVDFGGSTWSRVDVDRRASQVDLTVVVDPQFDHSIVLEYATDLFEADSVRRMGEQLLLMLHSVEAFSSKAVSQWDPLLPAHRQQLLAWGEGPARRTADTSLAACLEQGLQINPDAIALVFGAQRVTHAELDEASRKLATHLRTRGFGPGSRIGLCLPRSVELVVALLATIRSGATYVPLDPTYPEDRIRYQIEDAGLTLIIGTTATLTPSRMAQTPCLYLDQDWTSVPAATPLESGGEHGPAYLIYTSGSTGRPKGVCVPQAAVVNFLVSMAREPGLRPGDRVLAVTTLGFDIAVLELLLPLSVGATVVLTSDQEATDGAALKRLINTHAVTVMQATPSRWHLLLEADWGKTPGLRALVGGEPLPPTLASALLQRCDQVWNMYGPTETTVWSTCWQVEADTPTSLGRAIDNTQILVLDELGHLQPVGAWGEIWIGGDGVADGYWQRPELTEERFRTLEHIPELKEQRCYRTGDRGRWRYDGSLEHGGRLDDQVKLRGFRIELGEIEAFLASQTGVQRCVAVVREDSPGDQRLVAYLVAPDGPMDLDALRVTARQWLPEHMVPSQIEQVSALPVLPNGKINRQALPRPSARAIPKGRRQAPRTETERRLLPIWQELLQNDHIGIDDNFFDLGGHSMLAVRMIRRMETEFQRPVWLTMVFEQPTIMGMARQLESHGQERDKSMALLRPSQQPHGLFLLAGAEMYRELARQITVDMPVYGLFSQEEIDLLELPVESPLPPYSIDTLAGAYVELIRAQQPHGPYYLGGFSIGGVLAYEVAQRLMQAGEKIGLLVMLDCAFPGRGWKHLKAGIARRWRMLRQDGWKHVMHLYRQASQLHAARELPGGRRNQVYAQAIRQHKAQPSEMPVAFFQAAGDRSTQAAYGWDALASHIVIERVPGKHADILEMPNVSELAIHLSRHLAGAQRDNLAVTPQGVG